MKGRDRNNKLPATLNGRQVTKKTTAPKQLGGHGVARSATTALLLMAGIIELPRQVRREGGRIERDWPV